MSERTAAAIVFVVSLGALSYGLGFGLDVDVAVVAGDRVLHGEAPYRDFWTIYAPGSFVVIASLFAALGRELIVVHAAAAVAAAAACVAFWRLLEELAAAGGRPASVHVRALAVAAFALAIWEPSPSFDSYVVPRVLLLVAWRDWLRAARGADPGGFLRAGLAFGAAAFFKHDVAAYGLLGALLAVAAGVPRGRRGSGARSLGVGALAAGLPGLLVVALWGGVDAWQDLVVFPARDFAVVRGEPYPGWLPPLGALGSMMAVSAQPAAAWRSAMLLAEWAQAVLPQVVVIGYALAAARARRMPPAGALALASLPGFWAAAHVQQNTHLFTMGMATAMLLASMPGRVVAGDEGLPEPFFGARRAAAVVAVALACSFVVPCVLRLARMQLERRGARTLALPGTRGIVVPAARFEEVAPLAGRLRAAVPRDEPIHVGLARHDAVVIGDASLYFLADRRPATRYHEMHPGVVDREEVQDEIVEALERRGVRAVVRWDFGWPKQRLDAILAERRRARPELGALRLDRHLGEAFTRVARHGELELWWQRESASRESTPRATPSQGAASAERRTRAQAGRPVQ